MLDYVAMSYTKPNALVLFYFRLSFSIFHNQVIVSFTRCLVSRSRRYLLNFSRNCKTSQIRRDIQRNSYPSFVTVIGGGLEVLEA